jgi:hypothetical protein
MTIDYECKICIKEYKTYQTLWKHNKKFHKAKINIISQNTHNGYPEASSNDYTCKYCKRNYSRNDNLKRHENTCKQKTLSGNNEKIKIYICKFCNKEYNNKTSKYKHQLKCTKKNNEHNNLLENHITTIKNDIKKITETYPINNQLINIIMDKNKTIEELKEKPKDIIPDTILNSDNNSKTLTLNNVNIISRPEDNYINATQLCQAGNKKFSHWVSLDNTKILIDKLDNIINKNYFNEIRTAPDAVIPASGAVRISLIDVNKGGNNKNNQDSWIHPKLAIQLAQWISPDFALQVSDWIINLFTNGYVELNLKLLKEKDEQIKLLQNICMKKQKRTDYPEKNVIYILTTEENKKNRNYIIGKAETLKNRLGSYNKTAEHEVIYYKECKSKEHMNIIESTVLLKLNEYREKANRDRFILPVEKDISLFTSIIDQSIHFFN